jgi:phosphoribosylaminoimidazolecarboxamide formyltransferase/IMP cyclohydrolase
MVRAAAKNYLRVAAVTDPDDYAPLLEELAAHGGTTGLDTRFRLMQKAFRHTAGYDAAIAAYFGARDARQVRAAYADVRNAGVARSAPKP